VKISALLLVRAKLNYIYAQTVTSHDTLRVVIAFVNSVPYVTGIHYLLSCWKKRQKLSAYKVIRLVETN